MLGACLPITGRPSNEVAGPVFGHGAVTGRGYRRQVSNRRDAAQDIRIIYGQQPRALHELNIEEFEMSDISDKVKKIVVEHLGVEEDKVTDGASFIDDLGADSLDTVELVMAFEEDFGIEIPDDAAEKIQTVQDAINYISSNA